MAPPKLPLKAGDDYTVLALTIPPSTAYPRAATHCMYVRAHAPKIPSADSARSLFAVNVPVDATEGALRALFAEQLGGARIERVDIEREGGGKSARKQGAATGTVSRKRKRGGDEEGADGDGLPLPRTWERELLRSGGGAVLVFVDRASAEAALKEVVRAARKRREVVWKGEGALGVERYRTHQTLTFPARHELQARINRYLAHFATTESARAKALARQRSVPDADGFVTVTRGGRAGPARLDEAQAAADKLKQRHRAPEDFYRFQTREKKKESAEKLKRDFIEDRKRVERMRARRGKTLVSAVPVD
ncbi:uncharacterized protein K452DRAFT_227963 [Aplosporella prunicola CBS 121167]|uniref:Ribosomal RNA-processing protein 7 C-terminal domain-containing protein n=1 Tax=Aplosporella prunicola CBS 121167 TaxID=1176127 RepID=A0A6A6BCS9_9PEZI|nr:uncharacterized protein K452DRAFT_227963 [Aplosporella prunicola CBS 121167]KAF2141876.1 hypothetical protein K452DRAFT_227963 [Aplosporella prunicola CBS 121167]